MNRRAKITKRMVDTVVAPESGETNLWDSEVPGFSLRIRSSGSKVYVVEYRNRGQRKRRMTLGPHGRLTVDQARELARQILAAVARGEDPAEERQAAPLGSYPRRTGDPLPGTTRSPQEKAGEHRRR